VTAALTFECETSVKHQSPQARQHANSEDEAADTLVPMITEMRAQAVAHSASLRGAYTPVPRAGRPAITAEIGCPECAAPLEFLAPGRPETLRTNAIMRCTVCRVDVQVLVQLDVIHDPRYRTPNGCSLTPRKSRAA
jgi:hypothetical protein